MKKNYFKSLMQVALLLAAPFVVSSCDDVIGQEDNPVASYIQWKTDPGLEVTMKVGDVKTWGTATAVSSAIIAYESSDPSIASVDPITGEVTAKAVGDATIKAVVSGMSTNGRSVFQYGEVSYIVHVKGVLVNVAVAKDATEPTIICANPEEVDVAALFEAYPAKTKEFNNGITYFARKVTVDEESKKENEEVTDLVSIDGNGKLTLKKNANEDATLYVYAKIDPAPDGYKLELDKDKKPINNQAKIKVTLKKSIKYLAADGKAAYWTLADDKYTTIDNKFVEDAKDVTTLKAGNYYVTATSWETSKSLKINGNVNVVFADGSNLGIGNIQSDGEYKGTLNIFGQEKSTGMLYINYYKNWNGNAILDLAAINMYGANVYAYGTNEKETINNCKEININKGYLYANGKNSNSIKMATDGIITIANGGEINVYNTGTTPKNYAVQGNVTLTKGTFTARSQFQAVEGTLTAGDGYEFVENNNDDISKATKIEGTSSTSKNVWGKEVKKDE